MRTLTALAVLATLGACQQPQTNEAPANAVDPSQPAAAVPSATSAAEGEAVAEEQRKAAVSMGLDWSGRFAATPALCSGGAWEIKRDRIVTDGETSCAVEAIRESSERVEMELACTAEGSNTKERWVLTRNGRDGLHVVRNPEDPKETAVDLARCG